MNTRTPMILGKTPVPQPKAIETHGPYTHGNGWMAVNICPYPRSPSSPSAFC